MRSSALALMPGPSRRAAAWRFRKKSPVFASSASALCAFGEPMRCKRAQARLAQPAWSCPTRATACCRASAAIGATARSSRSVASAPSVSSTSGFSSPNGSLSSRMRASIGTTRGSFRPTSAAITAARASPVDGSQHRVQRAHRRRIVDAGERRHRGLQHAHVAARAAAPGAAAPPRPCRSARAPCASSRCTNQRGLRARRRSTGIAGGAELRRGAPWRDRWPRRRPRAGRPDIRPATAGGPIARISFSKTANSSAV